MQSSETQEKEPDKGNRTEKQKTVYKEFFAFWAYCPINKIFFKIFSVHSMFSKMVFSVWKTILKNKEIGKKHNEI